MQDTRDLTLFLLPRVKLLLLDIEQPIKNSIKLWISEYGLIPRVILRSVIDSIWRLVVGPMLPIIVKLSVDLAIGAIAPTLVPLIPLLYKIIDYLDVNIISDENKIQLKEILCIIEKFKASEEVKSALSISSSKEVAFESSQEYFGDIHV